MDIVDIKYELNNVFKDIDFDKIIFEKWCNNFQKQDSKNCIQNMIELKNSINYIKKYFKDDKNQYENIIKIIFENFYDIFILREEIPNILNDLINGISIKDVVFAVSIGKYLR